MNTPPLIQIIIGSTRVHRRADSIARWVTAIAERREDLRTEVIDLRELDLPFLADATPPMDAASRDPDAGQWSEMAASADGYVLVVPEYNHSYPAVVRMPSTTCSASGGASRSDSFPTEAPVAEYALQNSCVKSRSSSTWPQSAAR
jgi:hypothetical protein